MKSLSYLSLAAAVVVPAFSFVLPDGAMTSQVFLGGADPDKDDSTSLDHAVHAFEDKFSAQLDELIHAAAATLAAPAEDKYDAWEHFDGEAWISQAYDSADSIFGATEYYDDDRSWDSGLTVQRHRKSWHRRNGGARDDTDPRDGTDPGDGPPYHRDPRREPPHHTPSPPSGFPVPRKPKMPPRDHDKSHREHSILDILSSSRHTERLYELIKDDDEIKDILSDTSRNITLFAPSDGAFERLERARGDADGKPRDLIKRMITYHMADGCYGSQELRHHNTLMSMLQEDELGEGIHQRLRLGLSSRGPTVNYYAEVIMTDIFAKNGVIHGIDSVLLPPPQILDLIRLLPTEFSTSAGALAESELIDELPNLRGRGLTVFLPSNRDWQKLGFRANAFLFSDKNEAYLRAIMKYHIVPDHSLYSDAHVVPAEKSRSKSKSKVMDEQDDPSGLSHGYQHVYLPTLLGANQNNKDDNDNDNQRYISIDINRLERFLSFRANGLNSIIISDGIAKSGVVQVPDHVLLPPHTQREHHDPPRANYFYEGEIEPEELKSLLEPYVAAEAAELAVIKKKKAIAEL